MNPTIKRCATQHLLASAAMALLLLAKPAALAGPGAHGPNGEHLDGPATARAGSALPRMEAKTELFELVATLHPSELSVLVDRFETNEPVLNATLEVESGGVKAQARFHADQGDYAFDDPKLLALLRTQGEHGLVFTLVAGQETDLLDGTLVAAAARPAAGALDAHGHASDGDDHGHPHASRRAAWVAGGVAALGLVAGWTWWRRRRRSAGLPEGGV